jgi:drug/metabolite transporter (DMT)-like permease
VALLIITTILWAFSFSLIGEYLAGSVDSYFSVLMRVGLAALVFLPFLRTRGQSLKTILLYMLPSKLAPNTRRPPTSAVISGAVSVSC